MARRRYRTGSAELDSAIADLVAATGRREDRDLIAEMLVSTVRLAREEVGRGDLKLLNSTLKELRNSLAVFEPYQGIRKATVFGSARIAEGDPAYAAARDFGAAMAAVKPPYVRLCVEVDGERVVDFDQPVLMVAVGNGSDVGGGTSLAPHADPESGKVDVMVARSIGPLARMGYAVQLVRGKHPEREDVIYLRGSTVSVSGDEFYCSADGEVYGPERHRTWHVEPAAYRMVLPRR
jgi:hypothetical protein